MSHQGLPPVARVGRTADQARLLQWHHHSAHGLRTNAFRSRQSGNRSGTILLEPMKNGHLGWRKAIAPAVFAQATLELAAYCTDLGGKHRSKPGPIGCVSLVHGINIVYIQLTVKFSCVYFWLRPVGRADAQTRMPTPINALGEVGCVKPRRTSRFSHEDPKHDWVSKWRTIMDLIDHVIFLGNAS